jgi:putative hydrolase of HD superfamily
VDGRDRLSRLVAFLAVVYLLKTVVRNTRITDGSRNENSAEHSWHLALMATTFAEHAPPGADINHAIELLLLHDIVEIDAGDTDCYDAEGYRTKAARETAAADRLFGLLPDDQADRMRALWQEFEANETPSARYANALDRLQPMLLVRHARYRDWALRATTREQVLGRRLSELSSRHVVTIDWSGDGPAASHNFRHDYSAAIKSSGLSIVADRLVGEQTIYGLTA